MTQIKANWKAPKNIVAFSTTLKDDLDLNTLPTPPLWLKQTHGNTVIDAALHVPNVQADAIFSDHLNQVLVIKTADCLPILLTNKQGNWVGAIHAGWRGFSHDLIERTIEAYPGKACELIAWLGPHISERHFEVGLELLDKIIREPEEKQCFDLNRKIDKAFLNLQKLATFRLKALGLTDVYYSNHCTYEEEHLFPSYRRNGTEKRIKNVIYNSTVLQT